MIITKQYYVILNTNNTLVDYGDSTGLTICPGKGTIVREFDNEEEMNEYLNDNSLLIEDENEDD
jgi:hypothetical protein